MSRKRPVVAPDAIEDPRSDCPVACTLDLVGDRWTMVLLRDMFQGKKRHGEFLASHEGIQPAVLSDRIKKLERLGFIERTLYSEHPPRAEYRLTELGRTLEPILDAVTRWGLRHIPGTKPA